MITNSRTVRMTRMVEEGRVMGGKLEKSTYKSATEVPSSAE